MQQSDNWKEMTPFGNELLSGESKVRGSMRACDWAATPLGPIENWPQSLRAVVRVMLTSRFAMWMAWGPKLTFLCNDAYLPTVGIKQDWVIGSPSEKVWAEIWPDIGPRIEHVLTTGEATWDEALLLYLERSGFPEGTYHTFSYSPLSDDAGKTSGMLCVVAEVTREVISARQLALMRDLGARLAGASTRFEVMESLKACLLADPPDIPFALAYLNDSSGAAELALVHGLDSAHASQPLSAEDSTGWPFSNVTPGNAIVVDVAPDILQKFKHRHGQMRPDGALIVSMSSSEGGEPIGHLVVGLNSHRALDTDYKGFIELLSAQVAAAVARADEYERERRRAEALMEIDRAKTTFFSNISHEFRTPLTLMLGPLEDALSATSKASTEERERLELAHRNALRLLRLVNALLDFARIESGRLQVNYRPTDLAALTADLVSTFRSATDRAGLSLSVESSPLSGPVYVDRDMWEKIVLNLLSNAFKFTLEGEIAVRLEEDDGTARMTVHDTGTGIPAHELPKLFDRFHRVEGAQGRSFEGSGIGLALVQELVNLHGGDIGVVSEPGHGTTFTVVVPMRAAHVPAQADPVDSDAMTASTRTRSFVEEALRWLPGHELSLEPDAAPRGSWVDQRAGSERRCVLIADDNADLRSYIARLLSERGYEVSTAVDGLEALAKARAVPPDLIITDVMMPKVDGFGLLRAVRKDTDLRQIPIIMLSARAGEESKVEGLEAGADDYLTKPFSARELLARVDANIKLARLRREVAETIRASEVEAQAQAERVQLALDAGAIVGTWVWNVPEDKFIADERFARAFGVDAERVRAGLALDVVMQSIHEEDRQRVSEAVEAALRRGGPYRCEYRVRQDGTYRWIEANGRVDLASDGSPIRFPGVLIDIDHRRRMEEELRSLNENLEALVSKALQEREKAEHALRQSQKMEAMGQLTGGVAHDFNNLLTPIIGSLDLLQRRRVGGEREQRLIAGAVQAAERAKTLVQRLLAFARRQPLQSVPVDIAKMIKDMAQLVASTTGPQIKIVIDSPDRLPPAKADPNQLEMALLNLSVNARDAMPDGGTLRISARVARVGGGDGDVKPGDYICLSVSDTGTGMDEATRARAVEPFFSTKGIGKGTGLGLSMVHGLVSQLGGELVIQSTPGLGTDVELWLPKSTDGSQIDEPMLGAAVTAEMSGRALLVDDEEFVRMSTADMLQELGYNVVEAASGDEALQIVRQGQHFDVIITDHLMPGITGIDLARTIRAEKPEIPVLLISGYSEKEGIEPSILRLTKPFRKDELANSLSQLVTE